MRPLHPALIVEVLSALVPAGWEIREITPEPSEEMLDTMQLAAELRVCRRTVARMVRDGTGPVSTKTPGCRGPRFKRSDVEKWKAKLPTGRNSVELKAS